MKMRKAIFVTVLVAIMLAVIDTCLYILRNPFFAVLTGSVVIYGFLRGAVDFCRWLCQTDSEPRHLAKKQSRVADEPCSEPNEVYNWANDIDLEEPAPVDPEKTAAMMRVLEEDDL